MGGGGGQATSRYLFDSIISAIEKFSDPAHNTPIHEIIHIPLLSNKHFSETIDCKVLG